MFFIHNPPKNKGGIRNVIVFFLSEDACEMSGERSLIYFYTIQTCEEFCKI